MATRSTFQTSDTAGMACIKTGQTGWKDEADARQNGGCCRRAHEPSLQKVTAKRISQAGGYSSYAVAGGGSAT